MAPYLQVDWSIGTRWTLTAGLRFEHIRYRYDNRMIDGNTRDDGSPCGFGGCLYSRPSDRDDSFNNFAPRLQASYQLNAQSIAYAGLARGFRAPQMTELYRLQSGQLISDLDSEHIDSLELGWRTDGDRWRADISAYWMRKRDSVFRDAQPYNVSGARTRHHGVEASLAWALSSRWLLAVDGTWARHRYDFTFTPPRGEQFIAGNDVDTAPRWLGSTRLQFSPDQALDFELQWLHQGDYFIDAENRHHYAGHDLFNLRAAWWLSDRSLVTIRLNNLTDTGYADRADFAFGRYRYFPGRGRELFAEYRYLPGS